MLDLLPLAGFLFSWERWYLSLTTYFVCFLAWYALTRSAAKKRGLSPTYYCSLLHIACVIIPNLGIAQNSFHPVRLLRVSERARHTLLLSIAYFMTDSVFEPDRSWLLHHAMAIIAEGSVLMLNRRPVGTAVGLFWTEIGGWNITKKYHNKKLPKKAFLSDTKLCFPPALFYHVSRSNKDSKNVRVVFLVAYAMSRLVMILLNYLQWKDNFTLLQENSNSSLQNFFFIFESLMTSATVILNLNFLRKQYSNYVEHFHKGHKIKE